MKLRPKISIADHFREIEDPRIERTKLHKLIDIITITIDKNKDKPAIHMVSAWATTNGLVLGQRKDEIGMCCMLFINNAYGLHSKYLFLSLFVRDNKASYYIVGSIHFCSK